MRENYIFILFYFLCIAGTIVISLKRFNKRKYEDWMDQAAVHADMLILVYCPQTKRVDYVSESARWLFGLDKAKVIADVAYLFEKLGMSLKDEIICQFLQEEVLLPLHKDYAVVNARDQSVRSFYLRVSPGGMGRNVLTISERTREYEKEREQAEERNAVLQTLIQEKQEKQTLMLCLLKMMQSPVDEITVASQKVYDMINDVVKEMEPARGKTDYDVVSIEDLIKETVDSVLPDIKERGQKLELDMSVTDAMVKTDKEKLQRVVRNLLVNASMYTPEDGTVKLSVSECTGRKQEMGNSDNEQQKEYMIVVEDNGIGITHEFMPKLFEPFERADDPRVRGVEGYGLGLVVVKNILDNMGGRIEVESEVDSGSRFRVYLELEHEK